MRRYAAADRLMPHRWRDLIFSDRVTPQPIGPSGTFWYVDRRADGLHAVLVEPGIGAQRAAFDHEKAAEALTAERGRPLDSAAVVAAIQHLDEDRIIVALDGAELVVDLSSYRDTRQPWTAVAPDELVSPDRSHVAFVRDHDLWVRERSSGTERQLTSGGTAVSPWATSSDITSYRSHRDLVGYQPPPWRSGLPGGVLAPHHLADEPGSAQECERHEDAGHERIAPERDGDACHGRRGDQRWRERERGHGHRHQAGVTPRGRGEGGSGLLGTGRHDVQPRRPRPPLHRRAG
jgi:hypothetical protein